jgi:FtsP/CotA-like multicopper oxidase with cupredoxin domain
VKVRAKYSGAAGRGACSGKGGHAQAWSRLRGLAALWPLVAVVVGGVLVLVFSPSGGDAASASTVRTYYIAADTVPWNYAPSGKNQITGKPFTDAEQVFVQRGLHRIGGTYLKSIYRSYTDATFTQLKSRSASDAYLGLLGPVIRAEVGDTIKIVFLNRTAYPASVHAHGVFYEKDSEGAPYADGTSGADKRDDAVKPGGRHTYTWRVPERAGPGPMDGSSILWMYHSHTDEVADTNAGLLGPIVVTQRGMARADGSPKDVDRELFSFFSVMNENQSPYLDRNIRRYAGDPAGVDPDDEDFQESNLMHSINGYVYGNMPVPTINHGQRVRWYVFGLGTEVDLHTPHWHGNTVLTRGGMRSDMLDLLPGDMMVADMTPDDPGLWLYHCHVNDHILAGMMARYRVTP